MSINCKIHQQNNKKCVLAMPFCFQTRLNLPPPPSPRWLSRRFFTIVRKMGRTDQRSSCQCKNPLCISHKLHPFLWSRRNQRKSGGNNVWILSFFLVHPPTTHVLSVTPVVRHHLHWFTCPLVLHRWFHIAFSLGLCREPWKSAANGGKKR